MRNLLRRVSVAALLAATAICAACSSVPPAPTAVGDDFPGSCKPPELTWPTDFLEALPSEGGVGGTVVGLRLEYIDDEWMWRIRAATDRYDLFGERVDDPSAGQESLLDVRTLEVITKHDVELTEAEQGAKINALDAAMQSGEIWPSPLIIEMARITQDGSSVWQVTTCDTATNEQSVMIVP
ncbi:MAG TPA: hypothetical protein VN035_02935 [Microbacterium sp.]|nr:hypothetical protein [Microbacterium sp.]